MSKRAPIIRRVDNNQASIVRDLRKAGYSVLDIHIIGSGAPDLVVSRKSGWNSGTVLVEIKSPGGQYTRDELEFAQRWQGDIITAFLANDVKAWFTEKLQ